MILVFNFVFYGIIWLWFPLNSYENVKRNDAFLFLNLLRGIYLEIHDSKDTLETLRVQFLTVSQV